MNVRELNDEQLRQLKQAYLFDNPATKNDEISWDDLIESADTPNEVIFDFYDGIVFTEDDFGGSND